MERTKVSFEEMPFVMADLLNEVRALSAKVDKIGEQPSSKDVSVFKDRKVIQTPTVCKILGMTPVTIYRMVKRGELEGCKKGRCWYFFEDEVMEMLEKSRYRSVSRISTLADDFLNREMA